MWLHLLQVFGNVVAFNSKIIQLSPLINHLLHCDMTHICIIVLVIKALGEGRRVFLYARGALGDERLLLIKVVLEISADVHLFRHSESALASDFGKLYVAHADIAVEDCVRIVDRVVATAATSSKVELRNVVRFHAFGGELGR